jgi:hypothetical protein
MLDRADAMTARLGRSESLRCDTTPEMTQAAPYRAGRAGCNGNGYRRRAMARPNESETNA